MSYKFTFTLTYTFMAGNSSRSCEFDFVNLFLWIWFCEFGFVNLVLWIWFCEFDIVNLVLWIWFCGSYISTTKTPCITPELLILTALSRIYSFTQSPSFSFLVIHTEHPFPTHVDDLNNEALYMYIAIEERRQFYVKIHNTKLTWVMWNLNTALL